MKHKHKEIWLFKAFWKTYVFSSLDKLLEDEWPVIGPSNSAKLEDFDFKLGVTYKCPCDYGGSVLIRRVLDDNI